VETLSHPLFPADLPHATGMRILRTVRKNKGLSRTEIAHHLGLSKASVTNPVNKLVKRGFLVEVGKKDSSKSGGKRPIVLEFNPSSGIVVGLSIEVNRATVIVVDLNATIIERATVEYSVGAKPEDVFGLVFPVMHTLIDHHLNKNMIFLGIGIGLPGVIDFTTGVVILADTLHGWTGTDLRTLFENEFNVPVFVENDVKAMTLAESLFGNGIGVKDLVYLWVGYGIGAGIILGGNLHRGTSFSAGEVGYNEVSYSIARSDELPLLYREQPNFGDILTDYKLVNSVRDRLKEGLPSVLRANNTITVEDIIEAAGNGDSLCNAALCECASLLSALAITLINTLNPEVLILGGKTLRPPSPVLSIVKEKLHRDKLSAPIDAVDVRPALLDVDGKVLGSVGLVLHEMFDTELPYSFTKSYRHRSAQSVF
jgi:N-acetylglucosamine repressor